MDDIRRIESEETYYILCVANSGQVYHIMLMIEEDGSLDHDVKIRICNCHEKAMKENKLRDWENKNV